MVVFKSTPWTTSNLTNKSLSLTTHTLVRMALAKLQLLKERSLLLKSMTFSQSLLSNSRLLSLKAQLLSLSRPTSWCSKCTNTESSTQRNAEPSLTTLSLLLVSELRTVKITTLSETLGEQLGVKKATLESLPSRVKESVEFNKFLSSQPLTEIGKGIIESCHLKFDQIYRT